MPRFPISLLYEDAPDGVKVNPYKVPNSKDLQQLARKVAHGEKLKGAVDIVFCSDEKVRQLNKAYRKLDKVTDVLSFEWHEDDFAGEVFIATAQTQRQAPRFNNNYPNELRRVVVHGMLHLCGYDHLKPGERHIMRAKEDFYLGVADQASGAAPVRAPAGATKTTKAAVTSRTKSTKANAKPTAQKTARSPVARRG
jgi:probable rRNA maturation factor